MKRCSRPEKTKERYDQNKKKTSCDDQGNEMDEYEKK